MNRGTARYPLLEIDLDKLKANLAALIERCQSLSVEVAGVVKGFSALPEAAGVYTECGVRSLASSRLSQLRALRGAGVSCERVLIRIPMLSELPKVAEVADMSLQSELETLRALNAVCAKRGTRHRVILMADLGDLREGFWSREELVDAALEVEYKLDHLELAGRHESRLLRLCRRHAGEAARAGLRRRGGGARHRPRAAIHLRRRVHLRPHGA